MLTLIASGGLMEHWSIGMECWNNGMMPDSGYKITDYLFLVSGIWNPVSRIKHPASSIFTLLLQEDRNKA